MIGGYCLIQNNPAKSAMEQRATERMLSTLRKLGQFEDAGVLVETTVHRVPLEENLVFRQFPVLVSAAIMAVCSGIEVDEVCLGYVREGRATGHLDDFVAIYRSYKQIMQKPLPKLTFPVAHLSKAEIYSRLDPRLLAECVCCERPRQLEDSEFVSCGECRPCKTRTLALAGAEAMGSAGGYLHSIWGQTKS